MAQQSDTAYYTIASMYVVEGTQAVTSGDAFYDMLRDTPSYIPRRIARDVWSKYQDQTLWSTYRDRMDPEMPLLRRFFSDVKADHSQNYNVKIKYSGVDPRTGETVDAYVVAGFDHNPTMAEVENAAGYYEDYKVALPTGVDVSWNIEYMYHREDRPW